MAEGMKEIEDGNFESEVLKSDMPVLVDFWAPWCGPCRTLGPIIEKAVQESRGKVRLVKMNIDDHPTIPGQMGVQSIPAVIAFDNGQPVDGFMGAVPESQITALIDRVAGPAQPSNDETLIAEADRLLAEGALGEAGFAMTDIVRANYIVTDAALVDRVFAVLGEVFGEIRPAATMMIAGLIKPEMKVEIEVTAHRP